MLARLFFIFSFVTLLELAILMPLGAWMGWFWTLVLVFTTGFLGAALAKQEGLRVMLQVKKEFSEGKMPTDAMVDGLLILTAGLLLMTPGVVTDVVGFSLLIPLTRIPFRTQLIKYSKQRFKESDMNVVPGFSGFGSPDVSDIYDVSTSSTSTNKPASIGGLIDMTQSGSFNNGDVIDITSDS